MPKGHRVLVLGACIGLAVITFGLGLMLAASNAQEQWYESYKYAANDPLKGNSVPSSVTRSQAFEYRTPCEEPKGEGESQLCAQWRATYAAEDSAVWAKWGFWVGVVGSAFLLWQIVLTRNAVEETGVANETMREANRIAELSQRARILIDLSEFNYTDSHVEFGVYAYNIGQCSAVIHGLSWQFNNVKDVVIHTRHIYRDIIIPSSEKSLLARLNVEKKILEIHKYLNVLVILSDSFSSNVYHTHKFEIFIKPMMPVLGLGAMNVKEAHRRVLIQDQESWVKSSAESDKN